MNPTIQHGRDAITVHWGGRTVATFDHGPDAIATYMEARLHAARYVKTLRRVCREADARDG